MKGTNMFKWFSNRRAKKLEEEQAYIKKNTYPIFEHCFTVTYTLVNGDTGFYTITLIDDIGFQNIYAQTIEKVINNIRKYGIRCGNNCYPISAILHFHVSENMPKKHIKDVYIEPLF